MKTDAGVGLMVQRNGVGDDLFVPMPFDRAAAFMFDWWRALSQHYPLVGSPDPDATELPMVMITGDFRQKTSAQSDGVVRLMLQPYEFAGVGYELKPDEARELAHSLLAMADSVDAFQSPN
jgi:hypothetical protein